ncbi:MAG: pyridoxal phosphate-dependent aminotransferase [Bacteriovorax sp.]|nr:pyridoxal phosphate-dependent aminotransferase [Bacteriovorax sp.]
MTLVTTQAFGIDHIQCNKHFDLSIGEPKISQLPDDIWQEISQQKNINGYYPSHGDLDLREMILEKFYGEESVETIAITHGAIGALDFVFRANLNEDCEILLPDPGFPPYVTLAELTRAHVKKYKINLDKENQTALMIDWDHLESLITNKTAILLINSPHNPTGKILSAEDMIRFENILNKYPRLSFVMDEVYRNLIYSNGPHCDFYFFKDRGYILGSFSKMFPLQGARIGWVFSSSENIKKLSIYFNNATGAMSSFGQELAKSVLKRKIIYQSLYDEAYIHARKILDIYQVDYVPAEGSFFFFIKYQIPDSLVVDQLLSLGVLVVAGSIFGEKGESYVRASFAQTPEIIESAFGIIGKHWHGLSLENTGNIQ